MPLLSSPKRLFKIHRWQPAVPTGGRGVRCRDYPRTGKCFSCAQNSRFSVCRAVPAAGNAIPSLLTRLVCNCAQFRQQGFVSAAIRQICDLVRGTGSTEPCNRAGLASRNPCLSRVCRSACASRRKWVNRPPCGFGHNRNRRPGLRSVRFLRESFRTWSSSRYHAWLRR
jgi:hypothetical protein